MAELILERDRRLELRSQAHHLKPLVLLGARGLTEAVIKEIARALDEHGLVKIHVPTDDRQERSDMYISLADQLSAARIQMIGKMLVLWRKPKDKKVVSLSDDKAAQSLRKKATTKKMGTKKVAKPVIIRARPKHKNVTKKAALSKC